MGRRQAAFLQPKELSESTFAGMSYGPGSANGFGRVGGCD